MGAQEITPDWARVSTKSAKNVNCAGFGPLYRINPQRCENGQ